MPLLTSHLDVLTLRPNDAAYNVYAKMDVPDLIERYTKPMCRVSSSPARRRQADGCLVATLELLVPTSTRAIRMAWSHLPGGAKPILGLPDQ